MKIQTEFPNYNKAILTLIGDKNPILASNDNKILSYFLPLRNFKKGFDYFELTRHQNGGVYFSTVAMLSLRTIAKTESEIYFNDYSEMEWIDIIHDIKMSHFMTEEYQALKSGYVKKKDSGCLGTLIVLILLSISLLA